MIQLSSLPIIYFAVATVVRWRIVAADINSSSSVFDTSRHDLFAPLESEYKPFLDDDDVVIDLDDDDDRQQQPPSTRIKSTKRRIPQTKQEKDAEKLERQRRMRERRENARQKMREMIENPQEYSKSSQRMTEDELVSLRDIIQKDDPNFEKEENRWLKNNNRNNGFYYDYYGQYNNNNQYSNNNGKGKTSGQQEHYKQNHLANPYDYWDMWAQAYRMLGVYVNCNTNPNYSGNGKDDNFYYYKSYGNNNNKNDKEDEGCRRWVIWASYVNPNYQGGGWSEYFTADVDAYDMYYAEGGGAYYGGGANNGNNGGGCQRNNDGSYSCNNNNNNGNKYNKKNEVPTGQLDCHDLNTEWVLMGVYRELFYDYFEQISKHMWYYDSYEYNVAVTGLAYMGDGDCEYVSSNYGTSLYKAPKPTQGGGFIIGLYTDENCIEPYDDDDSLNADTAGGYYGNNNAYGNFDWFYYNKEAGNEYGRQGGTVEEYTLTLFNEVFEEFKYCTLCLDYPSYQDGYFNGDGYDEDDLINQCWKFYSHDTYMCDSDCIALGDAQGTINVFKFGKKYYGTVWDGATNGAAKGGTNINRAGFSHYGSGGSDTDFFLFISILIFIAVGYAFFNYETPMYGKRERLLAILNNGDEQRDAGADHNFLERVRTPRKSRSHPARPPDADVGYNTKPKKLEAVRSLDEGGIGAITSKAALAFARVRSDNYRPPTAPAKEPNKKAPIKVTTKKSIKPTTLQALKNAGGSPQQQAMKRVVSPKRTVAPGNNKPSIDILRSRSEKPRPSSSSSRRKPLKKSADGVISNHKAPIGTKDGKKAMVAIVSKHKNNAGIKHTNPDGSKQKGSVRVAWESGL